MKVSFRPNVFFIIITIIFIRALIPQIAFADTLLLNTHVDTTLDASQTYDVDGDVTVFPGSTLTIPAGTHLLFTANSHIRVNGGLVINGTAANHVAIVGGTIPVFIPSVPQSLITQSQSADVATPTVTTPAILTAAIGPVKHTGLFFGTGSVSTVSYLDISNGIYSMTVDKGSTVTADHIAFSDGDTGIFGSSTGSITLTNSSFTNVTTPADWNFHGTFTHSNTTFSGTGIKGWKYGGGILAGQTMTLDSVDGEYYIPSLTVPRGASLIINSGVTVFVKDGQFSELGGTFSAIGTSAKPITFYGDGVCPSHQYIFYIDNVSTFTAKYVHFNQLCGGLRVDNATVTLSNDTFDTIASTVLPVADRANVIADHITMHDVYQVADIGVASHLTFTTGTISLVNGKAPAISIHEQSTLNTTDISIDDASSCIGVSKNSAMNASTMTLNHCEVVGISSDNDSTSGPSGITMVDSEIMNSGTAIKLTQAEVLNVSNNKFHDNNVGVSLDTMPKTILINNWWGSDSGPTINSNPGGIGDSIITSNVAEVVYRPWIGMTTPPVRNPIIIVPGITGSYLSKNYGDKSELWPNIAKLALSPTDSFLDDLALLQTGTPSTTRPVTVGDVIRSAPGTDVFDGLIATLLQNGYKQGTDLFVLPYDWRLSNTTNQALLKDAITNALALSGKDKVNIIAHSMGGLLVKDYLAQNADAPIDHLFFVGTPNLGAPKAFKTVMYGDDMGFNFSAGSALSVHILNPSRIFSISQNMPAVYELLPSKKYLDEVQSYVRQLATPLDNDGTIAFMQQAGRNKKMFPFAQTLHDATDDFDVSGMAAYNFVGCGATKTVGKYLLTKKQSFGLTGLKLVDSYRLGYVAGDGTVPMISASAVIGAKNYFTTMGSHGTLPSIAPVATAIADIVTNGSIPHDGITGLMSTNSSCALSGEVVEVHSPVTLDIYDDQGRHTGPTANGDIEFGIPNVDYETIGEDKFVFLPTGPTYTVVNHALATGTYDMYISHSSTDDSVTRQTYFNEVPITTTKATGTVTIAPGSTDYAISMDQDGDDIVDSVIQPSAVLDAAQANDSTPPVTMAALSGSTVTLTATDDTAGVFNTKYSIDGIHWNIYIEPFRVSAGTTVQFLSIDKAGNTEEIKQLVVSGDSTNTPPPATQTTDTTPPVITTPTTTTQTTDTSTPQVNNNYYYSTPPAPYVIPPETPTESTDTVMLATTDDVDSADDTLTDVPQESKQSHDINRTSTQYISSTETVSESPASAEPVIEATSLAASTAGVVPLSHKTLTGIVVILIILTTLFVFIKRRR